MQAKAVLLWWEASALYVPSNAHISCVVWSQHGHSMTSDRCIHCGGSGQTVLLMFPLGQCFSTNECDPLVGNIIKSVRIGQHWGKSITENIIMCLLQYL